MPPYLHFRLGTILSAALPKHVLYTSEPSTCLDRHELFHPTKTGQAKVCTQAMDPLVRVRSASQHAQEKFELSLPVHDM